MEHTLTVAFTAADVVSGVSYPTILMFLAIVFGFYMAWNIGANDVANAMATSVGSKALTLRRAVVIAAVLEFAGAYFAGASVSNTIRKGIVDPEIFASEPTLFVCGMLAALLAAGTWLLIASYFGWPVSTTHSIVGAILGFGVAFAGIQAIYWGKVGTIAASWVISPVLSGTISYFIFNLILHKIFHHPRPVEAARRFTPYMVFVVFTILSMVLVMKGLKYRLKGVDFELWQALLIAGFVGVIAAFISGFLVRRVAVDDVDGEIEENSARKLYLARALSRAKKHLGRAQGMSSGPVEDEVKDVLNKVAMLNKSLEQESTAPANPKSSVWKVERIFIYLQVISAGFVAFAHGSNDVANAIGPMAAAWETIKGGIVGAKAPVSGWFLALGGIAIAIGLATWGWRVMKTVGTKITELTPSRGFAAEFGAATTIVIASWLALPISTTHTLVGAVLGVGLARGIGALNLKTVRDVVVSWVVTIPAGAGLAVLFYYMLAGIFA
ncbi:MAG: anion permease [Phycisphaerae bacterium]|nr:anion permease [Phycisphaerae bacterium]